MPIVQWEFQIHSDTISASVAAAHDINLVVNFWNVGDFPKQDRYLFRVFSFFRPWPNHAPLFGDVAKDGQL